ncbi:MAG: Stp1/IreP family PP2C-type Ser/Thr phosphatase [Oscillospiraceae bacterium]|nr:Stp1/IreP family PP2C-type Ser/Thr phosphatase [Oscillospiraceae bacterium]
MRITAKTDIGRGRTENQDNYRAGVLPNGIVWAVVCDGMGGANGGAVASRLAADSMEETFTQAFDAEEPPKGIPGIQENAIEKANETIYLCARQNLSMAGMGTTVVSAVLRKGVLYLSHVGDSRAYLYRDGGLELLTRDHSMVQALVEKGSITEEEAYRHPGKNLITRALGVGPKVEAESVAVHIRQGDVVLLCSDGLSNYVTQEEMAAVMRDKPFFEAAGALVDAALDAEGHDNITALLIMAETEAEETTWTH